MGPTAVGVRGGPWQDGWSGLVTFQWLDMSEQEVTTAPPGRRHSSFWSLVQVPRAGWRESDSWGQHSQAHPAVGQCSQAVLDVMGRLRDLARPPDRPVLPFPPGARTGVGLRGGALAHSWCSQKAEDPGGPKPRRRPHHTERRP